MKIKAISSLQNSFQDLQSHSLPSLIGVLKSRLPVSLISLEKSCRNRIYTPARTFWLFLYQILSGNLSMDEIVQNAILWLNSVTSEYVSPNTGAYSKARKRLPLSLLRDVDQHIQNQFSTPKRFHGYHLKVVDGTGISMPDNIELQNTFPQHPKAKKSLGFPILKLLAIFDLSTGILLEWAIETIITSDSAVFRLLWPYLKANDLVLGDRHFCGFAYFAFLLQRGVHCLTRKHQMRKYQKIIKVLGKGDLIVEWKKPRDAPKWLNEDEWKNLPNVLRVREVTHDICYKGFRTTQVAVVTTILTETIPAKELSELYYRRWKVELSFRDIKITMGMDTLKGRSVDIIEKELFLYIIAYNLIRFLMKEAAESDSADLEKISFKATVNSIRIWGPMLWQITNDKSYEMCYQMILKVIAYPRCRNKKNRSEPRARKKRPKNYQLLMGDRHQFTPVAHRGKRKAALK